MMGKADGLFNKKRMLNCTFSQIRIKVYSIWYIVYGI